MRPWARTICVQPRLHRRLRQQLGRRRRAVVAVGARRRLAVEEVAVVAHTLAALGAAGSRPGAVAVAAGGGAGAREAAALVPVFEFGVAVLRGRGARGAEQQQEREGGAGGAAHGGGAGAVWYLRLQACE